MKLRLWPLLLVIACAAPTTPGDIEQWKQEIIEAETQFDAMAQAEGLDKAFAAFAAEDGVIRRRREVIKGQAAIAEWYANDVRPNETLTWKPDFVDVSNSGDLGYTYGKFTFTSTDSTGVVTTRTGIFHTVWKRQPDGQWKFVWD